MKKKTKSRLSKFLRSGKYSVSMLLKKAATNHTAAIDHLKYGYYENHTIYLILIYSKLASHTWVLATEMDCADLDRRSLFSKRILKLSTYLKTNND